MSTKSPISKAKSKGEPSLSGRRVKRKPEQDWTWAVVGGVGLGFLAVLAWILIPSEHSVTPNAKVVAGGVSSDSMETEANADAELFAGLEEEPELDERDEIKPIVGEPPKPDPKQPAAAEKVMLTWPIRALKLSSGFGHRVHPVTGDRRLHRGVDVPAPCGTEVVAVEDGTVIFSDWTDSAGNVIKLSHDGGWQTVYMHLARTLVAPGMKVKAGELLALSGSTGRLTTGPHLHFEIHKGTSPFNPLAFYFHAPSTLDGMIAHSSWCGKGVGPSGTPAKNAERVGRGNSAPSRSSSLSDLLRKAGLKF